MARPNSGTASPPSGSSNKAKVGKSRVAAPSTVPKPKLDEYKTKIEVLQKEVNSLHKKHEGAYSRLTELTKGKSEFQKKRDDLRSKIDEVQQKTDKLESLRNRLVTQIEDTAKTGRDAKTKIQGLKKALGFQTSEEIDEKIRLIERHMMMSRLTVVEENKLVSEMRRLEKSKPLVNKYANMETETSNMAQSEALQLRTDFDNIKEELKTQQQKKRELNEALNALLAAHNQATAPARELSNEMDEIKRQLCEKRTELNQLRDEMIKKQREFEANQEVIYQAHRESMLEEKKRRNAERMRENIQNELEDMDDEIWSPDLQRLTQAICYVKSLIERSRELDGSAMMNSEMDGSPNKKENRDCVVAEEDDDGMVAMVPKKDREEECYFKPTKKKAVKKPKKQPNAESINQRPISHDILTLADFSRLGVNAPLTLQDCPALLQVLEEKRESLKKELSSNKELTVQRKAELIAKLEELKLDDAKESSRGTPPPERSHSIKAINGSTVAAAPVEIQAV